MWPPSDQVREIDDHNLLTANELRRPKRAGNAAPVQARPVVGLFPK
ncbi:hypothetical protein OJ998_15270 [Solirubrobacter taibaiensis]|nr:hypothetical protein [Solirubrobacter taibaiensis]